MQAVLYTHQLEPITVVDLPMWLWDRLGRGEAIWLAVHEPISYLALAEQAPAECQKVRTVAISGEKLRRRGHEALMLFTHDEENALRLQAEFLPGQRGELHKRERGAFAKGFIEALQNYMG